MTDDHSTHPVETFKYAAMRGDQWLNPVSYCYVPPPHLGGEPVDKVVDIPKGLQKLLKLSDSRGRVTRSHGPKKGRW